MLAENMEENRLAQTATSFLLDTEGEYIKLHCYYKDDILSTTVWEKVDAVNVLEACRAATNDYDIRIVKGDIHVVTLRQSGYQMKLFIKALDGIIRSL